MRGFEEARRLLRVNALWFAVKIFSFGKKYKNMKKNYLKIVCLSVFTLFFSNVFGQQGDPLVFSQDTNPQTGIGSSVAAADGQGYYAADDFMLDADANISKIIFPGYQFQENLEAIYTGAVLYIYEDEGGVPNGIPEKTGTPVYSLNLDKGDPNLEIFFGGIFNYEFTVQTPGLFLEGEKIYWVVFAPKINFTQKLDPEQMWTWYNSTNFDYGDAANIDPDDFFGSGLTYWLSINDMTGGVFGDEVKGLSFFLYGDDELGIDQVSFENQIRVFPNPTINKLNIRTPLNSAVKNIRVYDLSGRLVSVYSNDSTMDVSHFNSGSYLMEIDFTNGHKSVQKFMKM